MARHRQHPLRPTLLASILAVAAIAPAGAQGVRCPSPAELADLSRSIGTGPDSEKRAYAYFGQRYGRPAALNQRGNSAEITYGGGRGTIRISLERSAATGTVDIQCR